MPPSPRASARPRCRQLDGAELLEGIHAHGNRDSLVYWLEFKNDDELPSIFGSIAGRTERFFLVIDEINRGDIPRIFGELLTLLERTRRGEVVTLGLSGERFSVPANVLVIGTMNTADRSIALLDAALRRRFGFVELMPDSGVLGDVVIEGIPLGKWLDELNKRILQHVRRDARNLQIGHTYLIHDGKPISNLRRFVQVVRDDLIPLLEEYCYEDDEALERILGSSLVQRDALTSRSFGQRARGS